MTNITVIIPSNHIHNDLRKIVIAVCNQTIKPVEIMIIDSSIESGSCPIEIIELCNNQSINLIYKYKSIALPGEARNIGLRMVSTDLIAFIDVQTIPSNEWLEASLKILADNLILGVWGSTSFIADSKFERVVRDSLYGTKARTTLPGTVCRREVFARVGQFVDWVRAGEDTEWMLRVKLLKLNFFSPTKCFIEYVGLKDLTLNQMLKKWYRNYGSARDLPHFFPQRLFLWVVIYPFILLLAFNWNFLFADWRMDSSLYIAHITKIVLILPILTYLILRGIILPLKRGLDIRNLLPLRFIQIIGVCFMADMIKIIVFSLPTHKFFEGESAIKK
jgi:hypothetical protein